jgi:hypothetical protein
MRDIVEFVSGFLITSVTLGYLYLRLVNGLATEWGEAEDLEHICEFFFTATRAILTILISYIVLLVFSLIIIRKKHGSVGLGSGVALIFMAPFPSNPVPSFVMKNVPVVKHM